MPGAASTAGQIFNTESGRIEEILSKQIDTILPTLDPIWRDTVVSSQGVGPVSEFSRDFVVNKLYRTGMTGVIEQMNTVENFGLFGDSANADAISNRLLKSNNGTMKTFPDPADGPKAKTFSLSVPMRAMYTNLMLTLGELQMEATPAVIGDVIAPTLQGFAQNLSHTLCNYWYLSQNDSYRLGTNASGTVAAAAANGATASWTITIAEEAYERFFPGQRVDIYNSAGTARKNHVGGTAAYVPTYVHSVDDLSGSLTLVADTDWGDFAANDYIESRQAAAAHQPGPAHRRNVCRNHRRPDPAGPHDHGHAALAGDRSDSAGGHRRHQPGHRHADAAPGDLPDRVQRHLQGQHRGRQPAHMAAPAGSDR